MGKKRRRSETSEGDSEEGSAAPAQKRHRADKWSVSPELNAKTVFCHKLYEFIRKYKDAENRVLCEFLIRAPSKRSLPLYYDVVSAPIDLMKIQQKLKMDEYRTVQSFVSDVRLLLENTKTFYRRSSREYQDAATLERAFLLKLGECVAEEGGVRGRKPSESGGESPPSLTLKISKEQLRTISSGQRAQQGATARTPTYTDETSGSQLIPRVSRPAGPSSGKLAIRVKLTRSKAWLEEYVTSDDPIKIFLATVYDFHSQTGEFMAEAFHELPSAKDYPEYYRVITEPIDLNMIKKGVEDGHYTNLKAIQEDMLLMIKNAHYFNETGSEIYKSASTLRKFVINKCVELERKYQTVAKTQILKVSLKRPSVGGVASEEGEEESKKVPKLKLKMSSSGEEARGQRSSQSASSESESESSSSDNESSSEEEGQGESGEEEEMESVKHKLQFRIKKEKHATEGTGMDPVSKLLRVRKLPPLKKRLMAIYRSLVTKTDSDGRPYCGLFMRRPSAKLYPEYYLVIKQPIDLREILQKTTSLQYSSMEELMSDIDLMVNNACTFNEESSQVYNDALTIRETSHDTYKRLQLGWSSDPKPKPGGRTSSVSQPPPPTLQEPSVVAEGATQLASSQLSSVVTLFETTKNSTDSLGRYLWLTFKQAPASTDYVSVVKKPLDMQTIGTRVQGNQYATVHELFEDLHALSENNCKYYPKDSQQYKDAFMLYKAVVKKYLELTAKEREQRAKAIPNVQDAVKKLFQDIITKTLSAKDTSGRRLADSLQGVVISQVVQSEEKGGPVHRTLTLAKLEQWVGEGRYARLDQLQADLFFLLKRARETSSPNSQVYEDSASLQRAYLTARDKECRLGELLWSPALMYQLSVLESELSVKRLSSLPLSQSPREMSEDRESTPRRWKERRGREKEAGGSSVFTPGQSSSREVSEDRESTPASSSAPSKTPEPWQEETEEVILPDGSSCEYFEEVEYDGNRYRVGDIVHVNSRNVGKKPHIVLVEKLWKDGSGTVWLEGCWFYRPNETFHLATKKFYEKEIFKSDFHGIARLSEVLGRCYVMFFKDYLKFQPEGFSEEDVYMCESRYSYKTKNFRKIKIWNFLPGSQPKLVPRDSPVVLNRVPSVFAEQGTGRIQGGMEMKESESDRTKNEMEAEEEMEVSAGGSEHDTSASGGDVLEMSFCENLQNVKLQLPNPETNCTFYEQYCIDEDRFKLGDFVYVRSDQEKPFIARIDKMWMDMNGDPWFHGPWFVRPGEVEHSPTRMFLEKELFMSNIQDTNPMRSIMGRCSALSLSDYCRKRLTEVAEQDVFVVESRYNETDKEIRKTKNLRHFQLSASVTQDELYCFPQEIQPMKVPSSKLFSKEDLSEKPPLAKSEEPSGRSTPVSSSSVPPVSASGSIPTALPAGINPQLASLLNLNPQLLHTLLSSAHQLSSSKPVLIPLQQALPSLSAASPNSSGRATPIPSTPTTSSSAIQYSCRWEGCGQFFETASALTNHLLMALGGHIIRELDGTYYCRWSPCPRNPSMGGRPFDTFQKVTRHLKEVHLMKLSQSALGLTPRAHLATRQLLQSPSSSLMPATPTLTTPISATPPAAILSVMPTVTTTPTIIPTMPSSVLLQPASKIPLTTAPVQQVVSQPVVVTTATATTTSVPTSYKTSEVPRVFRPPPEDRRKLVHSGIYLKYIQGLQSDSKYMSSCEFSQSIRANQRFRPPAPIQASEWLSPEVIRQSDSVVDSLWTLRDHMLEDSLKLAKYLEGNQ